LYSFNEDFLTVLDTPIMGPPPPKVELDVPELPKMLLDPELLEVFPEDVGEVELVPKLPLGEEVVAEVELIEEVEVALAAELEELSVLPMLLAGTPMLVPPAFPPGVIGLPKGPRIGALASPK
jgi:hypothetical protein